MSDGPDEDLISIADYERAAERRLPRHIFDFVAGGAGDENVMRRNRTAFEALTLRPRYLRDVSGRDLATTVLGQEISFPVFVSPAGMQSAVHREGETATARGAGASRTLMIVPGGAGDTLESVAGAASGPLWLQFYFRRGREHTQRVVQLAEDLGFRGVCVTVDVPIYELKERDRRNRFLPPYEGVLDARHRPADPVSFIQFTWKDIEWLRGVTRLPIVLKGINTTEDALTAVERGVDGILISNHGGRALDATRSAIEALPEIADAVAGRAELYLDSGVRRGSDVLKALALGARAVGVGRPFYWGLANGGADGVHRVLEILRNELDLALAFCGQTSVRELEAGLVGVPAAWEQRVR